MMMMDSFRTTEFVMICYVPVVSHAQDARLLSNPIEYKSNLNVTKVICLLH